MPEGVLVFELVLSFQHHFRLRRIHFLRNMFICHLGPCRGSAFSFVKFGQTNVQAIQDIA